MNKSNLKKIKEITNERGISLKWLADKAGLSQQAVSAIINSDHSQSVTGLRPSVEAPAASTELL